MLAWTRWTRLAWCSALAVGLLGSAARAKGTDGEPSRADAHDEAGVVVIAIPQADAVLRERTLRPALAGHFADTHFVPELRTLATGDILAHLEWAEGEPTGARAHAVLWVETGREGAQQLYLLQPSSGRVWVRALPMASEPEVAAESLGVMARALALGLEAGEPVGMREVVIERASEDEGETGAAPEPAAEPVRARPEGMIALGYHGSSVSADRRWHSGAELRLGLRLPAGFLFGAGAAWAPPARGHAVPQVDLERVAIDVRGGWQWRPHPRVHPQLDAGVVAEALRWEVRSTAQLIGRRGTALRLGVAPGAGLTVRLWRGLGLRLHAQLDLWLRNADLVVLDGSERSSLVRMSPVAGRGDVGLVWWL